MGVSISCFELIYFNAAIRTAYLRRKEPCPANCGDPGDIFHYRYVPALGPPQQLIVAEPYTKADGYITCSHTTTQRRYSGVCNCGNAEVPVPGILF